MGQGPVRGPRDPVRHRPPSSARHPAWAPRSSTRSRSGRSSRTDYPPRISIAIGAAILYLLVGVTVGVAAARRRGTFADRALVGGTLFMSSVPYYLLALLALLYLVHPLRRLRTRVRLDRRRWGRRLVQSPAAAVAGARHLRLDPVHPVLPRGDGRVAERGLHTHGTRQGPAAADGDLQARAALRAGAGRHDLRHRLRVPARAARSSPSTSSRSRASAAGVCRRPTTRTSPSSRPPCSSGLSSSCWPTSSSTSCTASSTPE